MQWVSFYAQKATRSCPRIRRLQTRCLRSAVAVIVAANFSLYSINETAATQYAGPVAFGYTHDSRGRITNVSGSDGSSIDYQYDFNGNVTTINRQSRFAGSV